MWKGWKGEGSSEGETGRKKDCRWRRYGGRSKEGRAGGNEGKESEEDECQRVILELASFPGGRKTARRSKPQSDKRSQPTNEPANKRMNEENWFFSFTSSGWFLPHRWCHHHHPKWLWREAECFWDLYVFLNQQKFEWSLVVLIIHFISTDAAWLWIKRLCSYYFF